MLQETNSSVPSTTSRKDIRYEVLDLNSQGMYLCQQQQFQEAHDMLSQAYHLLEEDTTLNNARASDELRSTTLNNLGVVECHMGQHRQALTHLDVAQTMERQWGIHSPSVCLNICAACNALQMYDRASAAALDTIHLLRQQAKALEVQQQMEQQQQQPMDDPNGTSSSWKAPNTSEVENNNVLWGAAWHNLAIAQLNSADGNDLSEYTNALVMFQNAMKATSDLLGMEHPMTLAVHETYRAIRADLRRSGAYKQHRTLLTAQLPPITGHKPVPEERDFGKTLTATARSHDRDLHVTIRGKQTKGVKQVERYSVDAYDDHVPKSASSPRQQLTSSQSSTKRLKSISPRHPSISVASPNSKGLRGIPLSGNLLTASTLYRNPHPLLLLGGSLDRVTPAAKATYVKSSPRYSQTKLPAVGGAPSSASAQQQQQQTNNNNTQSGVTSEMLMGEMWVEAPRLAPAYMQQANNNAASSRSGPQQQQDGDRVGSPPRTVRPVYSQQLYVLPDADHRVSQPQQDYAHMDQPTATRNPSPPPPPTAAAAASAPPPPPQQQQQSPLIPAPPTSSPPSQQQQQQQQQNSPNRTSSAGSRPSLQQVGTELSAEQDTDKYPHLRAVLKQNDEATAVATQS